MSKVRACWIELIDCWIPYSGIRKKKELRLFLENEMKSKLQLTAKQSVFLRIQVRASSQTKGLERG